jgi:hypothetical protein
VNGVISTFNAELSLYGVLLEPGGPNNCGGYGSTITSLGQNLVSDDSCGVAATGDVRTSTPLLGPLADNGGPTPTHLLLPGSPALDVGDGTSCPEFDQRGVSRPQGSACDSGAVEMTP